MSAFDPKRTLRTMSQSPPGVGFGEEGEQKPFVPSEVCPELGRRAEGRMYDARSPYF